MPARQQRQVSIKAVARAGYDCSTPDAVASVALLLLDQSDTLLMGRSGAQLRESRVGREMLATDRQRESRDGDGLSGGRGWSTPMESAAV
jgi:hypothetical protein